ncbi:MAG: ABC transporter substrate-binding protein [Pseudochelatococcus sp.]|jgi:ABC-type transport system substrate-binding protein|uniref:ABC transporter substrate-binding protein n=1 Tax=Pseudochelatococcus sp. TaxID=2020869 RepID=UPI003D9379B2
MTLSRDDKIELARLLPDMRRRMFLIGIAAAATVGVTGLPARGNAQAASGRLRVASLANPSSLDPATGGAGSDHVSLYNFYDTLVDLDPDTLSAKPGLARSFVFSDPATLVLDLQEGVTFHDGTPLDAEAVKFNLDRNRSAQVSNIRGDLASVESVEASGPLQVTLRLKQPDAALPLILSDRAGMMVSPTALKAAADGRVDRAPVGAGPWKFVSWTDGERIVAEAHAGYWQENLPGVRQLELTIIPEASTRLRAVQSGQVDIAYQISERQLPMVERNPNLVLKSSPTLYNYLLYLNCSRGPLKDVRVRQAMNLAVDREAYVFATQAGVGEVARMNLPKSHWAYSADAEEFTVHDPDRARALMAEAGFANGIELDFRGFPDQAHVQRQEVVLSQLAKIGVRGRFTNAPIAEASGRFFGEEKLGDVHLSAWTGRPDPTLTYALLYSKDSYFNSGRVPPPAGFDEAIAASRSSSDQAERAKALATVQRLAMEAAMTIPLSFRSEVDAVARNVRDHQANLLGKPKFRQVTFAG